MKRFFRIKPWLAWAIYVMLDLACIAAGMGVPVFSILLGFPVGFYIARRFLDSEHRLKYKLNRMLMVALVTSLFTFAVMTILWGPVIPMLFDPAADLANFGIPMILYEPKLSFAAWLVLMVLVSPFLQLLSTIFALYLTLVRRTPE